jgi:FKBP-type peptidyl-prolyl cis-trans isomerase 2
MTDTIKKGDKVKVAYTGKLEDGNVFDSSEGKEPLSFEVGANQVIPGFDNAIEGMKKDEEKTFTLSVEEAYGPVKEELVQEFPKDKLPDKPEPKEGMMLIMQAPTGQQIPAKIVEVKNDIVKIDINHPLAGKALTFEIKVVGINEPEDKKEDKKAEKEDKKAEKDNEEESCKPDDCGSCCGCN